MKHACAAFLLLLAACSAPPQSPGAAAVSAAPEAAGRPAAAAVLPDEAPAPVAPSWMPPPALDAEPAAVPMPAAPALQRAGSEASGAPADAAAAVLPRNGHAGGRLQEVGQRALFTFESDAGEQSLFELAGFGYSRAAKGRAVLAIADASGSVLWQSERDAGSQWRDFAAFVAPRAGTFTYSIALQEGGFRFVLVRQSNYAALATAPQDLGARALVHGHLPNGDAVAVFRVPVAAGEELALKVVGTREEARQEARRGATEMAAMVAGMQPMRENPRAAPKPLFQSFDLEISQDGAALGPAGPYLRFSAPQPGFVDVRVRARPPVTSGGLFDLLVERELAPVTVEGVVVDGDDAPLAGVELLFLREPDADPVGRASTDEQGRYSASVIAGDLAVQLLSGRRVAREMVRVRVLQGGPLDLVFLPGARARGR